MRKFLSMLLVLTLMFALAVPAFADCVNPHNGYKVLDQSEACSNEENKCTFDAHANLEPQGDLEHETKVHKVKIEWSCTEITGTVKSTYTWVTEDFTEGAAAPHYEVATSTLMSTLTGGDVTITIKNRSNNAVNAGVAYEAVGNSSNVTYTDDCRSVRVDNASSGCNVHSLNGEEKTGTISGKVTLIQGQGGEVWNGLGKGGCTKIGTFTVTITAEAGTA